MQHGKQLGHTIDFPASWNYLPLFFLKMLCRPILEDLTSRCRCLEVLAKTCYSHFGGSHDLRDGGGGGGGGYGGVTPIPYGVGGGREQETRGQYRHTRAFSYNVYIHHGKTKLCRTMSDFSEANHVLFAFCLSLCVECLVP